jgi:hypothetical protein
MCCRFFSNTKDVSNVAFLTGWFETALAVAWFSQFPVLCADAFAQIKVRKYIVALLWYNAPRGIKSSHIQPALACTTAHNTCCWLFWTSKYVSNVALTGRFEMVILSSTHPPATCTVHFFFKSVRKYCCIDKMCLEMENGGRFMVLSLVNCLSHVSTLLNTKECK